MRTICQRIGNRFTQKLLANRHYVRIRLNDLLAESINKIWQQIGGRNGAEFAVQQTVLDFSHHFVDNNNMCQIYSLIC